MDQVERRENAILMYGEEEESEHMFWVDRAENVGLKIRVREKRNTRDSLPLLVYRSEEMVSYEVEITGISTLNSL